MLIAIASVGGVGTLGWGMLELAHSAPTAAQDSPGGAADQASIADARRVGDAFAAVAARVQPSVVSIRVEAQVDRPTPIPFGFMGPGGMGDSQVVEGGGSGFVISSDGAILTNRHVIENATRIRVVFQDGRNLPGRVIGIDRATDLAVLRVEASGLRPLRFAQIDQQRVGQWVVAVGSPFGLDMTVTAGVLSAVGRGGLGVNEIEDYLQTDASINPGNSGGPLVNLQGEVIGVNSMIIGRGQGIGFAIPADMAQNVAQQLIATGHVERSWLGVGFQELTPELAANFGVDSRRGALINQVVSGGPAAQAGLRAGDIVLAVNGTAVAEGRDLLRQVLRHPVGSSLQLQVRRDGSDRTVSVRTVARPGQEDRPAPRRVRGQADPGIGMRLSPLTPDLARRLRTRSGRGAVVIDVAQGGAADRAGLRQGDIIIEADRAAVRSPAEVQRALSDGQAVVRAERGDSAFYAVIAPE